MSATTIPSIVTPGARAIAAHARVSDNAAQAAQHTQAEAARQAAAAKPPTHGGVGKRTDVMA